MDLVQTITPTAGVQQAVHARPAPAPVEQAVATELAAAKTVTAANTAAAARNNNARQDDYQRGFVLDPASREVIYRVIDVRSRQVVRQIPEKALLRMRAYTRALAEGKSGNAALAQADLQA
jgi:uncharacterized FlaG/YvyC family protein